MKNGPGAGSMIQVTLKNGSRLHRPH